MNCQHKHLEVTQDTHKYQLVNVPSVSSCINYILGNKYRNADIDPGVLKKAQQRGTCVHKNVEKGFENDNHVFECEDNSISHKAYYKLLTEKIIDTDLDEAEVFSELSMFRKDFLYCGTADLIIAKDHEVIVVDFKTTKETSFATGELQLRLYAELFLHNHTEYDDEYIDIDLKVGNVVYENKTYKLKEYSFKMGDLNTRNLTFEKIRELHEF